MSGGHFNHAQYRIEDIASEIERIVRENRDSSLDEWGECVGRMYPPKIVRRLKIAVRTLRKAHAMAHRVDWLLSNDDGEEAFLRRWDEDLEGLKG